MAILPGKIDNVINYKAVSFSEGGSICINATVNNPAPPRARARRRARVVFYTGKAEHVRRFPT